MSWFQMLQLYKMPTFSSRLSSNCLQISSSAHPRYGEQPIILSESLMWRSFQSNWGWARIHVRRIFSKAFQFYSLKGCLLHLISFSSTVFVLLAFLIVDKHAFSTADIIITYVLLVGAILLEIYAVLVLVTSDWTILWLSNHKNSVVDFFYTTISSIPLSKNKRWSNTMGQYNLIK